MKRALILTLCLLPLCTAVTNAGANLAGLNPDEARRMTELQKRLCADRNLSCAYVTSLFDDPRLTLYTPPEPAPAPSAPVHRERQRNPYLTDRFGLTTPESLDRCRGFVQAHYLAFDAAYQIYGVPKEVICGHLRIETDFGMPTRLSPHPLGTIPAIDRLVTLYVRRPGRKLPQARFVHRQVFALNQLKDLLQAANDNSWDLFNIPGSSTGAIGLLQFEPSSFNIAVDGDGDGKIDLFNPEDAILSLAHYLVTRGWDGNPQHQQRAIFAYYGGNYERDRNKFYMKAVLKYAEEIRKYFSEHPVEPETATFPQPLPLEQLATLTVPDNEHPTN